jgi:hypothetical protein
VLAVAHPLPDECRTQVPGLVPGWFHSQRCSHFCSSSGRVLLQLLDPVLDQVPASGIAVLVLDRALLPVRLLVLLPCRSQCWAWRCQALDECCSSGPPSAAPSSDLVLLPVLARVLPSGAKFLSEWCASSGPGSR